MTKRGAIITGLLFTGTLATAALVGSSRPSQSSNPATRSSPRVANPGAVIPSENGPFVDGQQVTLEDAEAKAGFVLHRPDHTLASDNSIKTVWLGTVPSVQVSIEYESGVEVRLDEWDLADTPDVVFGRLAEQFASDSGAEASDYLTSVEGAPALVIPDDYQGQKNQGSIQFVLSDNVRAWVYGHYDTATLTEIAGTIK